MSLWYSHAAVFSQEAGAWVGLCAEFASLSHLAPTQIAAIQGIAALVTAVDEEIAGAGSQTGASA